MADPNRLDLSPLEPLLERHREQAGGLLPLLHAVQETFGYVPSSAVEPIARSFNLSRAEVHGVVTYYHFFRSAPPGRALVQVCLAESCKAAGADALMAHAEAVLGCGSGAQRHHTRADGAVTLEPVYCLGLCAMSPAIMVDERPHARMTNEKFDRVVVHVAPRLGIAA